MPGQKISSMTLVNDLQDDDRFPVARNGSTYSVRGKAFASKTQIDALSASLIRSFTTNTTTRTLTSNVKTLSSTVLFKPTTSTQGQVLTYNSYTHTWVASGLPSSLPIQADPYQIITYSPLTHTWIASAAPSTSAKNDYVPLGTVTFFAANVAPVGWFECAGQLINKNAYIDLWNVIGYTFGRSPDGSQFKLPDLRGEFVRGWDDLRGIDPNRSFGSFQKGSLAGDLAAVVLDGPMLSARSILGLDTDYGQNYPKVSLPNLSADSAFHLITEFQTLSSEGPSLSAITGVSRPRNVALMACIKYAQIVGLTPIRLSAQNILNTVNALSGFSMGYNQYWRDVTSSRLSQVKYTNSTGRPIMAQVYYYSESLPLKGTCSVAISSMSGGEVTLYGNYGNGGYSANCLTFIVPPSNTYKVSTSFNGITSWVELR